MNDRLKRIVKGAVAALVVAAFVAAPGRSAALAGREGEILPMFETTDVGGNPYDLRSLARENTMLVFFWDSYKTMAIREINFLNSIYDYYHLYGLEIAAVEGGGKDAAEVGEALEKLAAIGTVPSYTVLPDPGGRLATMFRVSAIPETFIVNRGGKVLYHLKGFSESDGAALEHRVKDILGLLPAPSAPPAASSGSGGATARKRGVTVDPENQIFEKYRYFGNYYFNLGDMEKAVENYRRCLDVNPRATEIHLRVGEIYAVRKEYDKAREAWEKVLEYDPDNGEADALIRRLIRGEF